MNIAQKNTDEILIKVKGLSTYRLYVYKDAPSHQQLFT